MGSSLASFQFCYLYMTDKWKNEQENGGDQELDPLKSPALCHVTLRKLDIQWETILLSSIPHFPAHYWSRRTCCAVYVCSHVCSSMWVGVVAKAELRMLSAIISVSFWLLQQDLARNWTLNTSARLVNQSAPLSFLFLPPSARATGVQRPAQHFSWILLIWPQDPKLDLQWLLCPLSRLSTPIPVTLLMKES